MLFYHCTVEWTGRCSLIQFIEQTIAMRCGYVCYYCQLVSEGTDVKQKVAKMDRKYCFNKSKSNSNAYIFCIDIFRLPL